jgi:hypothetical protein
MLSLLLSHQEAGGTLSWVARDSQDMLEFRIHSRCSAFPCILMVGAALESKPCEKFSLRGVCLSGSEADPDSSAKLLTSYTHSPQPASEKNHHASCGRCHPVRTCQTGISDGLEMGQSFTNADVSHSSATAGKDALRRLSISQTVQPSPSYTASATQALQKDSLPDRRG